MRYRFKCNLTCVATCAKFFQEVQFNESGLYNLSLPSMNFCPIRFSWTRFQSQRIPSSPSCRDPQPSPQAPALVSSFSLDFFCTPFASPPPPSAPSSSGQSHIPPFSLLAWLCSLQIGLSPDLMYFFKNLLPSSWMVIWILCTTR